VNTVFRAPLQAPEPFRNSLTDGAETRDGQGRKDRARRDMRWRRQTRLLAAYCSDNRCNRWTRLAPTSIDKPPDDIPLFDLERSLPPGQAASGAARSAIAAAWKNRTVAG
jgi:hypothetical protein